MPHPPRSSGSDHSRSHIGPCRVEGEIRRELQQLTNITDYNADINSLATISSSVHDDLKVPPLTYLNALWELAACKRNLKKWQSSCLCVCVPHVGLLAGGPELVCDPECLWKEINLRGDRISETRRNVFVHSWNQIIDGYTSKKVKDSCTCPSTSAVRGR